MATDSRPAGAHAIDQLNGEEPERTLGQLVVQATQDLTEIVRGEVALAKAEIAADVRNGAMAGGMFGAAGYLGMLASILLSVAAAYGLRETGLPAWAAFLIVALVYLLVAAVLVLVGRSRVKQVGPPTMTIQSTKETIAAVKPGSRPR